jgi:Ras-related protein Rab-8A
MKNIEQHASENVCKILLGNKCDLIEQKVVESARAQSLANEYEIPFMETSAKANIQVEASFFRIAQDIKRKIIDAQERAGSGAGARRGVDIGTTEEKKKKKGCC